MTSRIRARLLRPFMVAAILLLALPGLAGDEGAHHDPVAPLVLAHAAILVAAKVGRDLAVRLKQPAVLGELVAGVLLGNLHLVGVDLAEGLKNDTTVDIRARVGVILLLFEVGLESTVGQMMKVGASALLVATIGVIVPMALGYGVGALLLPEAGGYAHLFLGAKLCATSVGITARVLKDLNASHTNTARVVLGAAVIDDVQGLVVLAVVAGLIGSANSGTPPSALGSALIVLKAGGFLFGAIGIGMLLSKRVFRLASGMRTSGVLLATGLSICFVLAWAADAMGLAAIVGAFAAGLVLEQVHFKDFTAKGEPRDQPTGILRRGGDGNRHHHDHAAAVALEPRAVQFPQRF